MEAIFSICHNNTPNTLNTDNFLFITVAHLNLGQLLASRGLCEEAETVLRHCSKLDSTGVKDPKLHETTRISALLHLGRLLADRGRYREAISIYKETVHSLPEYYQPQVNAFLVQKINFVNP